MWLFRNGASLEVDTRRISVTGDSAGGFLAIVATLHAMSLGLDVASQALIYPVTDTSTDTPSYHANGDGFFLTRSDMIWFLDSYFPNGVVSGKLGVVMRWWWR